MRYVVPWNYLISTPGTTRLQTAPNSVNSRSPDLAAPSMPVRCRAISNASVRKETPLRQMVDVAGFPQNWGIPLMSRPAAGGICRLDDEPSALMTVIGQPQRHGHQRVWHLLADPSRFLQEYPATVHGALPDHRWQKTRHCLGWVAGELKGLVCLHGARPLRCWHYMPDAAVMSCIPGGKLCWRGIGRRLIDRQAIRQLGGAAEGACAHHESNRLLCRVLDRLPLSSRKIPASNANSSAPPATMKLMPVPPSPSRGQWR